MIVALIVDPKATKELVDLIQPSIPIWIVHTPDNRALRGQTTAQITTFVNHFPAPFENAFYILPTMYEHHPGVTELMVAGINHEDVHRNEWNRFGLKFVRNDSSWELFHWMAPPSE